MTLSTGLVAACSLDYSLGALGLTEGADSSASAGDSTDGEIGDAGDTGETGNPGPRLDVGPPDGPPPVDEPCDGVDLVFVVDNSLSMKFYQDALGLAFPEFVDTMVAVLPPGTNVHVGVTSTEMGYSPNGISQIVNGVCTFEGEMGKDEYDYYITPEQTDTGRNGAQGRLYLPPGDTRNWIAFNTSDPGTEVDAAKTWFSKAAAIGKGGSNVKMMTAPAGWVGHPINAGPGGPNAGFFRDAGTVTVVFFMHDHADMTPELIQGQEAGAQMLQLLTDAKSDCGGAKCIVGGGFLETNICGPRPIDNFLGALPNAPIVAPLPDMGIFDDPQKTADEMNALLSDVLADVIADTCELIPPAG